MGPPKPPAKANEGEYEVVKRLGAGCFGEVWKGTSTKTKENVAMKFEFRESKSAPQLFREVEVIKSLRDGGDPQGVVNYYYYGKEGSFNCMVMEMLGKSLEDHVQSCGGKLTATTTGLIAEQVLQRIEFLHSKRMLHRDIKPENFMFGIKNKIHHVYIIDFGLSKLYWDSAKNSHSLQKTGLSLTGTARYASINAHKGIEQSRRDDLEAIGHMFLYFLRCVLPWSGLDAKTQEEKYRKICEKKEQTPIDDLCRGFPEQFGEYLKICRGLGFNERPDYNKLYEMIRTTRDGRIEDHHYQWYEGKAAADIAVSGEALVALLPRAAKIQPDDKASASGGGGAGKKGCCVIS